MPPFPGRVVIAHDYVTQRGGAERVALDLLKAFPGARLVTSFWDEESSFPEFSDFAVETVGPNNIGFFRKDPRRALPMLARTFANHTIVDADLVICSSSGWSHRVQTTGKKIVYCHNPARWLYQPEDYFGQRPDWVKRIFAGMTNGLRESDHAAARSASHYLVNSSVVARRVRERYDIAAEVLAPARGLSVEGPVEPVVGLEPGFLLTIGRDRGYKNIDAIVAAVGAVHDERLVIVGGTNGVSPDGRVVELTGVSDGQMRWLYSNARALVAVAHEDFGLTAIEAQTFGLPAVLLRKGGYLDSAVEDLTAVFIDSTSPESIIDGIARMRSHSWDRDAIRRHGERYRPTGFAEAIREVAIRVCGFESSETEHVLELMHAVRVPDFDFTDSDDDSEPERRVG